MEPQITGAGVADAIAVFSYASQTNAESTPAILVKLVGAVSHRVRRRRAEPSFQYIEYLILNHLRTVSASWNSQGRKNPLFFLPPATRNNAADRRSAALRYTDGSAPRTAAITAQQSNIERQTPIPAGQKLGATSPRCTGTPAIKGSMPPPSTCKSLACTGSRYAGVARRTGSSPVVGHLLANSAHHA